MKTDYAAHDVRYRKLRAAGGIGWTTAEDVDEIMAGVEAALRAPYAPRRGRALELGCGAGETTLRLAVMGFDAFGIDISETAIAWAREKAADRGIRVDFREGNVLDLRDWPVDFFDFVLDGRCFHCIIGEDRGRFLAEVHRVLRPDGVFHVRSMCGEPTDPELRRNFDPGSRCQVVNGIALRHIGLAADIVGEIRSAGFHVLRQSVVGRKNQRDQDDLLVDATKTPVFCGGFC